MGNYISKPNTLTNKENLLMRKTRYLVGPVEPYNSASLMIKFVFVFSSPHKFTHFSDSNSHENNGLGTKTTIKRTTSKQNKWPIWMKRNCLFLNFWKQTRMTRELSKDNCGWLYNSCIIRRYKSWKICKHLTSKQQQTTQFTAVSWAVLSKKLTLLIGSHL